MIRATRWSPDAQAELETFSAKYGSEVERRAEDYARSVGTTSISIAHVTWAQTSMFYIPRVIDPLWGVLVGLFGGGVISGVIAIAVVGTEKADDQLFWLTFVFLALFVFFLSPFLYRGP